VFQVLDLLMIDGDDDKLSSSDHRINQSIGISMRTAVGMAAMLTKA